MAPGRGEPSRRSRALRCGPRGRGAAVPGWKVSPWSSACRRPCGHLVALARAPRICSARRSR
eukprot:scaffold544_cov117-Isochrysis_galbana.AAC.23